MFVPVILNRNLLPLLDVVPGLQPDVVVGVKAEPGITHTAVVTQSECGEDASTSYS